jgi:hypothetical protein
VRCAAAGGVGPARGIMWSMGTNAVGTFPGSDEGLTVDESEVMAASDQSLATRSFVPQSCHNGTKRDGTCWEER